MEVESMELQHFVVVVVVVVVVVAALVADC